VHVLRRICLAHQHTRPRGSRVRGAPGSAVSSTSHLFGDAGVFEHFGETLGEAIVSDLVASRA